MNYGTKRIAVTRHPADFVVFGGSLPVTGVFFDSRNRNLFRQVIKQNQDNMPLIGFETMEVK